MGWNTEYRNRVQREKKRGDVLIEVFGLWIRVWNATMLWWFVWISEKTELKVGGEFHASESKTARVGWVGASLF